MEVITILQTTDPSPHDILQVIMRWAKENRVSGGSAEPSQQQQQPLMIPDDDHHHDRDNIIDLSLNDRPITRAQ